MGFQKKEFPKNVYFTFLVLHCLQLQDIIQKMNNDFNLTDIMLQLLIHNIYQFVYLNCINRWFYVLAMNYYWIQATTQSIFILGIMRAFLVLMKTRSKTYTLWLREAFKKKKWQMTNWLVHFANDRLCLKLVSYFSQLIYQCLEPRLHGAVWPAA